MRHTYVDLDLVAIPLFVLHVEQGDRPVYAAFNKTACATVGRDLADFLGKTAEEAYGGEMGARAYRLHQTVLTSRSAQTYELALPLQDRARRVRTTLTPEIGADGAVTRLFGVSEDITFENSALGARASLDAMNLEMERYLAMAAHDLRSPMRNMTLLATMLREECAGQDGDMVDLIDMMCDISTRTMALISEVLANATATEAMSDPVLVDFTELCEDIFASLDPQARHRIVVEPAQVTCDRVALQIVLRNLMDNALKHGGRDRIALRGALRPLPAGRFELTLCDDGLGFDDPAVAFLSGGALQIDSGYGLFAIRRLLARCGGSIAAEAREGGGALVRVTLPGSVQNVASRRPAAARYVKPG